MHTYTEMKGRVRRTDMKLASHRWATICYRLPNINFCNVATKNARLPFFLAIAVCYRKTRVSSFRGRVASQRKPFGKTIGQENGGLHLWSCRYRLLTRKARFLSIYRALSYNESARTKKKKDIFDVTGWKNKHKKKAWGGGVKRFVCFLSLFLHFAASRTATRYLSEIRLNETAHHFQGRVPVFLGTSACSSP